MTYLWYQVGADQGCMLVPDNAELYMWELDLVDSDLDQFSLWYNSREFADVS